MATLAQAGRLMKQHIETKTPVFLWGPPGVGKSDKVRDEVKSRKGWKLIDFRAVLRDTVAMLGVPDIDRDKGTTVSYYKHIGIYACRKNTLLQFTKWAPGVLEQAEKLEQLRYLENGISIKMVLTEHASIGIDTPADLELARQYLSQQENIQA